MHHHPDEDAAQRPPPPATAEPLDDGAADHLQDRLVPDARLDWTAKGSVSLAELAARRLVLYLFPRMSATSDPDPTGWMDIPGAYGCTQQTCAFRDRLTTFRELGCTVAGLSAQTRNEQLDTTRRLEIPFPLLADPDLVLHRTLRMPTFEIDGMVFYKRLTLIAEAGRIVKVFYPVHPPEEHPTTVLAWLESR